MAVVSVSHLKKYYRVHQKEPGFLGSLKSFLRRQYYQVQAVDDISFSIEKGELVGFIGPNGAGKTTTLKCLSGLLYPTAGKISVLGFSPHQRKNEFLRQISLVMGQKNQLWWDLPALDSLLLNKEIYEVADKEFEETLRELSKLLEMKDLLKTPVRKLSLGQRMKAELMAALIHRPKILFLDEPTIGLDVVMQKKIRDFIAQYNRKYRATILLTSHYMDDVASLCRRIIIIDKGKILYDGLLEKITKKYAPQKIITIILDKDVSAPEIAKIGEIKDYYFPKVVFSVPRNKTRKIAGKILKKLPVADLTIQDPPLEEIIRQIFTQSQN